MFRAAALLLVLGFLASASGSNDDLERRFKREFQTFHTTGERTDAFEEILFDYALTDEERNGNWQTPPSTAAAPRATICILCNLAVTTVLDAYALGSPIEEIAATITDLCVSLNIQPQRVCKGVIDSNLDVLEFILNNGTNLNSPRICAIVFQGDECGHDDPSLDWSIDLGNTTKPERTIETYQVKAEPFNILQITDIHYDPNYLVGGNADCGEPMCCRWDQGEPEFPNATAGRWGDYRSCDISWEVVTDALTFIPATHQNIDYIYMTGDMIDHGVWDTSRERNNETYVKITNAFVEAFGDIPVFPCLGNHEPHPMNVFAPSYITQDNISSAWIYQTLADLWSAWLPEDTRETILRGGFYTVLVRPGFRVVALNNMQCYGNNWFLIYDHHDPDGQLQWLVETLLAAEANGEKVHLLYHIPPGGSDCYHIWSREFNRIIDRFEATVAGQFSGHTHNDEFHMFYSHDDPTRASNVLFTGGSLTSYSNTNPNYRIYNVDPDSLNVVDHETWIYNMTDANIGPVETLNWYKMYSFKEAYGVASLDPVELDSLVHRMAEDENILQQYFRFYNLNGDPKLEQGCDQGCLDHLLCALVTSDSSDSTQCDLILGPIRARRAQEELVRYIDY